jgi:hypothetical protein
VDPTPPARKKPKKNGMTEIPRTPLPKEHKDIRISTFQIIFSPDFFECPHPSTEKHSQENPKNTVA